MANFNILNLSERNFASEMIVGQANGSPVTQVHPQHGTIFSKSVAIERGRLVGLKSDGKVYLASAAAGAGQVAAIGWNFQECANGQAIDVMKAELEVDLGSAVSGAGAGKIAYLSPTTPGAVTATKPSAAGQLIQIVGVFVNDHVVKYDVQPSDNVIPATADVSGVKVGTDILHGEVTIAVGSGLTATVDAGTKTITLDTAGA